MTLRLLPLTTRESERSKNGEAAQSPHDIFFAAVQEAKNNTPSKSQVHTRERERERKSLAIPGALSPSEFGVGCFCWLPGRLRRASECGGGAGGPTGAGRRAEGSDQLTASAAAAAAYLAPLLCCAPPAPCAQLALSPLFQPAACHTKSRS
jgi:hypothetical protein